MKKVYFLFLSLFLLSSCYFDDAGDPHIADWFWILLIIIGLLIFIGIIVSIATGASSTSKSTSEVKPGYSITSLINAGSYMGGHTSIDNLINRCFLLVTKSDIEIYERKYDFEDPKYYASIPINKITDIQVEDGSTIEKKITLGRVLLVGIFALAWQKRKKYESGFVTIEWNDGKFNHNIIFGFEGKNAIENANTLRNKLINRISRN